MLQNILLVGLGSFLGGSARYALSYYVQLRTALVFPLGTLLVNILGCFLIGLFFSYFDRQGQPAAYRLFFVSGILGGFTTFSAFSYETLQLYKQEPSLAIAYLMASLFLGIGSTFLAISIFGKGN
jgi:fluoride exporter